MRHFTGRNWKIILVVSALSFLTLYGVSTHVINVRHIGPLEQSLLGISGISTVEITTANNVHQISLSLSNEARVADVIEATEDILYMRLNGSGYKISIQDTPDDTLLGIYDAIHPYLYEGMRTGGYPAMMDSIAAQLANYDDIEAQIHVRKNLISVNLQSGPHVLTRLLRY